MSRPLSRLTTRKLRAAALVARLALFGAGGCVFGSAMTPQIIQESGTHTFAASYDKVFSATVSALKAEGYPIASVDPGKGFIKTGQKLIRMSAMATSSTTAVATEVTRQYVIHMGKSPGGVTLSAEPRIFQGNAELSDRPVWDIDGPQGERALWSRLFRDIQEAL